MKRLKSAGLEKFNAFPDDKIYKLIVNYANVNSVLSAEHDKKILEGNGFFNVRSKRLSLDMWALYYSTNQNLLNKF